jgi:broad specificity phosphatase PhoE
MPDVTMYWLRHAESVANAMKLRGDKCEDRDTHLTIKGMKDTLKMRKVWQSQFQNKAPVSTVYYSTMCRTRETAELLFGTLKQIKACLGLYQDFIDEAVLPNSAKEWEGDIRLVQADHLKEKQWDIPPKHVNFKAFSSIVNDEQHRFGKHNVAVVAHRKTLRYLFGENFDNLETRIYLV